MYEHVFRSVMADSLEEPMDVDDDVNVNDYSDLSLEELHSKINVFSKLCFKKVSLIIKS